LIYMMVGSVLIYIAGAYDIIMGSVFGNLVSTPFANGEINFGSSGIGTDLFGYASANGIGDQWSQFSNTLLLFVQLIGFLSFIRGWFIIAGTAQQSQQGATMGKGLTHIIGGVLAINLTTVVSILRYSAGIN